MSINSLSQSLSSKFQLLCQSAAQKHVYYLDDYLYRLDGDSSSAPKFGLVILSPNLYFERTKTFPIDNSKDLEQVLKLEECAFPKCDTIIYHVSEQQNGYSTVSFWEYCSENVGQFGQRACFIPASLLHLLVTDFEGKMVSIAKNNKTHTLYLSNGRLASTSSTSLIMMHSLLNAPLDSLQLHYTSEEYAQRLFSVVHKIPLQVLWQIFKQAKSGNQIDFKRFSVGVLLGLCIAGVVSYSLTYYQLDSQRQRLQGISHQVDQAFLSKKKSERLALAYQELHEAIPSGDKPITIYWSAVAEIYKLKEQQKIRVRFHRYRDDEFTVSVLAEKATDIIKLLQQNPKLDARLVGDVSTNRYGESFMVKVHIKPTDSSN